MSVVARIEVPPPEPFCECKEGARAEGAGYRLIAPATATEPLVMEAADGSVFFWTPTELCYRDEQGQIDFIAGSAPVQLEVRGREARYRRAFPSSDEVHIAQPEGRKYWLVLHERPRDPASYLQGEIWFGVSGMVGGVPLPPGIHRTMESFGFQFKAPFAADLMDASTECWYEVVDTEDGQMLFIWCRADWLLDPDRVFPVKIDPTVEVDVSTTVTNAGGKQVAVLDGIIFAILRTATNQLILRCSVDKGESWFAPNYNTSLIGPRVFASLRAAGGYLWLFGSESQGSARLYRGVVQKGAQGVEVEWTELAIVASKTQTTYYTANDLDVVEDAEGFLVLCAYRRDVGGDATPSFVAVRVEPNGTVTVGNPLYDTTYARSFILCRIAQAQNAGHVCWVNTNEMLEYRELAIYGTTLSVAKTYSTTGFDGPSPPIDMVLNTQGLPIVAVRRSVGQIYILERDEANNWSSITPLRGRGMNLTITKNDVLYLFYLDDQYDGTLWQVTRDQNGNWSEPVALETGGGGDIRSTPDDTGNMICVIYRVGTGAGGTAPYNANSYTLVFNQPPQKPSNLNRPNFDATDGAVFEWQHNDDPGDGQSTYHLQILLGGNVIYDTGEVQSPVSQHLLPANTLQNGHTYQWRVRTADQSGEWSPWSDYAVFQTGPKPVATIIYPTEGATVSAAEVTVEWSVSGQSSATVRLYDEAGQTVLQEHEVTTPSARARTITGLQNNTSYQVSVQPVSSIGVVGDEVFSGPFTVQYTPPPKPEVTAEGQQGFIRITITNPAPAADEPEITHNDLYRRKPGQGWMRIATGIEPGGTYDDYAAASGVLYEYRVRAVGANGTYTDSEVAATLSLAGLWLHDVADPGGTMLHLTRNIARKQKAGPMPALHRFAGRQLPVAEWDAKAEDGEYEWGVILTREEFMRLQALVARRAVVCARDSSGRRVFGVLEPPSVDDQIWGGHATTLKLTAIDYTEEV